MKRLLLLLILLPIHVYSQTDTVIYEKEIHINAAQADVKHTTEQYVKNNKVAFFNISGYASSDIVKHIDTSIAGNYQMHNDTLLVSCIWIYIGSRNNCVVLKGVIQFTAAGNNAVIALISMHYTEYNINGTSLIFLKTGNYQELGACLHCSATGIRLSKVVNDNFAHLLLSYHEYLKNAGKRD